jgi:hypothetical protein
MPSHWLIVSNNGQALHHTLRKDTGSWQGTWGDVLAVMNGRPDTGAIRSATFHTDLTGNLHVCVLTTLHNIWHTIRFAAGNWQGNWGNVNNQSSGLPAQLVTALASSVSADNSFQLCALTPTNIYHTIRHPNNTWQANWGNVNGPVPNPPLPANLLGGG